MGLALHFAKPFRKEFNLTTVIVAINALLSPGGLASYLNQSKPNSTIKMLCENRNLGHILEGAMDAIDLPISTSQGISILNYNAIRTSLFFLSGIWEVGQ